MGLLEALGIFLGLDFWLHLWPLTVPERGNAITQRKTLKIEHSCLFIFVEPRDDPKGRWQIGGEVNVPVNVAFQTLKSQAKEIKSSLTQKGIPVTGKPIA